MVVDNQVAVVAAAVVAVAVVAEIVMTMAAAEAAIDIGEAVATVAEIACGVASVVALAVAVPGVVVVDDGLPGAAAEASAGRPADRQVMVANAAAETVEAAELKTDMMVAVEVVGEADADEGAVFDGVSASAMAAATVGDWIVAATAARTAATVEAAAATVESSKVALRTCVEMRMIAMAAKAA